MENEIKTVETIGNKDEIAISVKALRTQFFTYEGIVQALDEVSLDVKAGEIYGLVGESGCGKSVTAMSIMDLIPDPPGRIISGQIIINGFNTLWDIGRLARIDARNKTSVKIKRNSRALKRHSKMMSEIRGKWISMVFQDPGLSLNPVLNIEKQLIDPMLIHEKASLADSIIRRETIKKSDIDDLMSALGGESPLDEKFSAISSWCSEHGMADVERELRRMVGNDEDVGIISKNLVKKVRDRRTGIDVIQLSKIRSLENLKRTAFELELELLTARQSQSNEKVAELQNKLRIVRGKLPSNLAISATFNSIFGMKFNRALRAEARNRAIRMLEHVNLSDPERILRAFPHELSGGMQQRIMIAMALSLNPKVLIADEPTTALDVTTQAQILDLVNKLNAEAGTSVIFITHDLAVVAQMCDSVGVMYAGNLVEESGVEELFANPKHPYTIGLLKALPGVDTEMGRDDKFESIAGDVPNLITPPTGCRFHTRCSFKFEPCDKKKPELVDLGKGHRVACFLYSEKEADAN